MQIIKKNLIDLVNSRIYPALIKINEGIITSIEELTEEVNGYVLPGFIDSHIHIESSMLIPSEFARIAVKHGTIATISDPHEIANVMGVEGVNYMIDNGNKVPFYFFFGAPSCVPATSFETAGAEINSTQIKELMSRKEILYLAEMMNYPGVINGDSEVLKKIQYAKEANKPIDGHAPGLRGKGMQAYFSSGITTDHECFMYEEGKEKAEQGVKILIREGSAAKNFNELIPLIQNYPNQIMFCSDDKHPDNLLEGHINLLVKRALHEGYDLFEVLRAASLNTIKHYNLPVGYLQAGHSADFICIDNLTNFTIEATYIKGIKVAENGISYVPQVESVIINNFLCNYKEPKDFIIPNNGGNKLRVIEALDGQLITNEIHADILLNHLVIDSNIEKDILKIAVVNRYTDAPIACAFIKNIGLKSGAIASCIAHDCHNIVAVGTNDDDICKAVNAIIKNKGGISLADGNELLELPLPVAGIMTNQNGEWVAEKYTQIDKRAKQLGTTLHAPFMTLSFMALLVIPKLKLSDKGLFDGQDFKFTSVQF